MRSICGALVTLALTMAVASGAADSAERQPPPASSVHRIRIGVLPFVDARSDAGAAGVDVAVSRLVQTAMIRSKRLLGVAIAAGDVTLEGVDVEKAADLGRRQGVDAVLVGTLLEAQTDESTTGGSGPSIFGTSARIGRRSVRATVSLQAELIGVTSRTSIASVEASGKKADNKFSGGVDTLVGSWDVSDAFLASPLGKALQEAVTDLVHKIESAPWPARP